MPHHLTDARRPSDRPSTPSLPPTAPRHPAPGSAPGRAVAGGGLPAARGARTATVGMLPALKEGSR